MFVLLQWLACASGEAVQSARPNVLVVIADDLGVDATTAYAQRPGTPPTPRIDALAESGVAFDAFWATPACTTTRAALITGQHGFQSGVDHVPAPLPAGIETLPGRLQQVGYHTAAFGKWHLGGGRPAADHPSGFGIDHFAGNLGNIKDYEAWELTVNGESRSVSEYHTTKVTDLALEHLQSRTDPWFAWVAYAAPHAPFHQPPASLTSLDGGRPAEQYKAMVNALDTEVGRLLDGLAPDVRDNTIVVFIGDNGTPKRARDTELFGIDHVKGSLYEGGIRTPFVIAGPGIRTGERDGSMVNATDLFATVLGLVGVQGAPEQSHDFSARLRGQVQAPRTFNYSEYSKEGVLGWAIRDDSLKVIVHGDGRIERFAVDDLSENSPLADSDEARALLARGWSLRGERPATDGPCVELSGHRTHSSNGADGRMLEGEIELSVAGSHCVVQTNSVPDHRFGDARAPFPHAVEAVAKTYRFPANPQRAAQITPLGLDSDDAILLNGVPVDVLAAACFGVGDGKIGCNQPEMPWRYDPVHPANTFRLDAHHAHTQPDGGYHYHGPRESEKITQIIGFAADGFPIRSPWVEEDGALRSLTSSYRLREGQRAHQAGEADHPGGAYDGTFRDDWEFVEGHGDLDRCNGFEFPAGYAYVATPTYPYFPACFVGRPDPSFKKGPPGGRGKAKTKTKSKTRSKTGRGKAKRGKVKRR